MDSKPLESKQLTAFCKSGVSSDLKGMAEEGLIKVRDSHPLYGPQSKELVAHYSDIAHLIKNGDGAWFRGVMPWSLAIRIGTRSVVSHGGILGVENHHIQLIDTCEGIGCRKRTFKEQVYAQHGQTWRHGQWYWGGVAPEYRKVYDREKAWEKANSMVGAPYGHYAIIAVAMWQMPILREIAFMRWGKNIEADWTERTPYCSMSQSIIACDGGGVDPCPGRALQWTTPQDTYQSLLWSLKIALINR